MGILKRKKKPIKFKELKEGDFFIGPNGLYQKKYIFLAHNAYCLDTNRLTVLRTDALIEYVDIEIKEL